MACSNCENQNTVTKCVICGCDICLDCIVAWAVVPGQVNVNGEFLFVNPLDQDAANYNTANSNYGQSYHICQMCLNTCKDYFVELFELFLVSIKKDIKEFVAKNILEMSDEIRARDKRVDQMIEYYKSLYQEN